MSIIRYSFLEKKVYVPEGNGVLASPPKENLLFKSKDTDKKSTIQQFTSRHINEQMNGGVNLGPLCFLIHGHDFNPRDPKSKLKHNPHTCLYRPHYTSSTKSKNDDIFSWPAGLQLHEESLETTQGIAIACAWESCGKSRQFFNSYYSNTLSKAGQCALNLVDIIVATSELLPEAPLNIFCHGMGAEIAFQALTLLAKEHPTIINRFKTIQSLGAITPVDTAMAAVEQIEKLNLGEKTPEFFNILHSDDDSINLIEETVSRTNKKSTPLLGTHGLSKKKHTFWLDIQINHLSVHKWFHRNLQINFKGHDPDKIHDHAIYYRHSPNMLFYQQVLWQKNGFSILELRNKKIPEGLQSGFITYIMSILGLD